MYEYAKASEKAAGFVPGKKVSKSQYSYLQNASPGDGRIHYRSAQATDVPRYMGSYSNVVVQRCKDPKKEDDPPQKTYQTYTKTNPETGKVYSGRTSGTGTALENIERRDRGHHMTEEGFGPAVLDMSTTSWAAVRGREQMLIDYHGGAQSTGGTSGNAISGIRQDNPRRQEYLEAARKEFGELGKKEEDKA